ncbi:hypothetical protein KOPIIPEJ_00846 [Aeromonas dhakensis]|uniref:hypothetical protein n=1 Tax=Aeromonas dhakensis TaxID=196024 RepID=UPI000E3BF4B1|nr:hypothetical protein [Aeromonas dhakensis]RFS21524.1 hypothetical protein DYE42_18805 [Aeromonas dhakensis]
MKPIADIALMAVVVLGLMALGNTQVAWLLICLPLVYWCWPVLAWTTKRPITARPLLLALATLTCWHGPAGLFTALSIALIWTAKTLKASPRPQRKGGPVIKNYYFWS